MTEELTSMSRIYDMPLLNTAMGSLLYLMAGLTLDEMMQDKEEGLRHIREPTRTSYDRMVELSRKIPNPLNKTQTQYLGHALVMCMREIAETAMKGIPSPPNVPPEDLEFEKKLAFQEWIQQIAAMMVAMAMGETHVMPIEEGKS